MLAVCTRVIHAGGMMGGFCATNLGHFKPAGVEGWRLAFQFVAIISFVCCLLVLRYAADPRKKVGWMPAMPAVGIRFT